VARLNIHGPWVAKDRFFCCLIMRCSLRKRQTLSGRREDHRGFSQESSRDVGGAGEGDRASLNCLGALWGRVGQPKVATGLLDALKLPVAPDDEPTPHHIS